MVTPSTSDPLHQIQPHRSDAKQRLRPLKQFCIGDLLRGAKQSSGSGFGLDIGHRHRPISERKFEKSRDE
jgi:hypothetical protein